MTHSKSSTVFHRLNHGWNAEPNAPNVSVEMDGPTLVLSFKPNQFQYPAYADVRRIEICFEKCNRYRIGSVNDEGWFRGQCRFSRIAPAWGEFYEVTGDLKLDAVPNDWIEVAEPVPPLRHYLFYFRDEEFECDAQSWNKVEIR